MNYSQLFFLLITTSLISSKIVPEINQEEIPCKVTKISRGQAERAFNKEVEKAYKKADAPWYALRPKPQLTEDDFPARVIITNNSSKAIYIPMSQYLGVNRMNIAPRSSKRLNDDQGYVVIAPLLLGTFTVPITALILWKLGHLDEGDHNSALITVGLQLLSGIIGFGTSIYWSKKLTSVGKKLENLSPLFESYVYKIEPGETFKDILILPSEDATKQLLKNPKLVYVEDNRKEWDPHTMPIIPDDGYVYFYNKSKIDLSKTKQDIVLSGILDLEDPVTIKLHKKSSFFWGGQICFNDNTLTIEQGTLVDCGSGTFWEKRKISINDKKALTFDRPLVITDMLASER